MTTWSGQGAGRPARPEADGAEPPRNARLVVRDVWPDGDDGTVIVHEQYQQPARWWHPATRLAGILMILLAIGWPVILLSSGWIRTGLAFAIADLSLLATGLEVFRSGAKKWLD
ncbi:hypothetical protein NZL82_19540 [Sphingomonas sanguinis]|uniref:hypothetical protein n=1 Tax=Sphingomonas sp. LC-1 TaxID=3110957 RepID=UPI0021BB76D1|nr:hypothetical protein [Sphingomonas sp. LC-1]MCT8004055.1 hypothetical protein [Sphingomonas sp. LC-1]